MIQQIKKYTSLVHFAHTVFALPFALIGFTLAYKVHPPHAVWLLLIQVLVCMVTARNSAMSFNRYVDRYIDALNDRTKQRELPAGKLSPNAVLLFFFVNAALFIICTYTINKLCFWLSFPALTVLCGYSYTKRFTWFSHLVLGLALAIAPAGAYIAVTGTLTPSVLWLSVMVIFWVGGFDIIYSLPDEQHDRAHKLHSVPQRFGRKRALWISGGLHLLVAPVMVLFGIGIDASWIYWGGALFFAGMLIYQHVMVWTECRDGIYPVSTTNGMASVVFALLTMIDLFVK